MKTYKEYNNTIFTFFKLSFLGKIKILLRVIGLKKIINFILYPLLSFFFRSKIFFIREIVFNALENFNEKIYFTNKYNEKFLLFTKDKVISKETFVTGEFDLIKLKRTLDFLNKKKNIINLYDIGANIGTICIPAVKRNYIKNAFAVEPEIKNFEMLKFNIILNNLEDKIKTFNYALSSTDQQNLKMEISNDNFGDHRIRLQEISDNLYGEKDRELLEVKSTTFDKLFKNIDRDKDLVWIDTQGFEPLILEGALNLINSKAPLVIEFWPYALKRNNLWNSMEKIIKKYDYFIDLSNEQMIPEDLKVNLNKLFTSWDEEKPNKPALFTDLLLLKS